jgi:hypothetical protein
MGRVASFTFLPFYSWGGNPLPSGVRWTGGPVVPGSSPDTVEAKRKVPCSCVVFSPYVGNIIATPRYTPEGVWGAPLFLSLGTAARYPRERNPPVPIAEVLGGPQSRPGAEDVWKILRRESNPGHPDRSLAPILTELPFVYMGNICE